MKQRYFIYAKKETEKEEKKNNRKNNKKYAKQQGDKLNSNIESYNIKR
jgi:hypothetical protein